MSRICFHGEQGDVEVYGTERAYMGKVLADIGLIPLMSMCDGGNPQIMKYIPERCYLTDTNCKGDKDFKSMFRTWFRVSDDGLMLNSEKHSCFGIMLNTALVFGSDPIKLYARIHGQCEQHTFVEGENREWLAAIIQAGLDSCIYRKDRGWEDVIELLAADSDNPIVLSYSICESFPNRFVAEYEDDVDGDTWYEMNKSDQWAIGIEALRTHRWLELKPSTFGDYGFDECVNSFAILADTNSRTL